MKPKLTGLEREAFEMWRCGCEGPFNKDLELWHDHVCKEQRWLRLARRIRRKVAKAFEEGHKSGAALNDNPK